MKHDISTAACLPRTPSAQEGKDALPPPAPPHSLVLAAAGNDAPEGLVCDGSPACLETGNTPNLDSTMTSSSSSSSLKFADVVVRYSATPFSVYT